MPIWVVAVEYAGPDLLTDHPGARRPLLEHAYDLEHRRLAHGDDQLRVGFPHPTRGWPRPPQLTRCAACSAAVLALVAGSIGDVVGQVVTDLTRSAGSPVDRSQDDLPLWASPPRPSLD